MSDPQEDIKALTSALISLQAASSILETQKHLEPNELETLKGIKKLIVNINIDLQKLHLKAGGK